MQKNPFPVLLAATVPLLDNIISLTGAVAASFLGFIAPALIDTAIATCRYRPLENQEEEDGEEENSKSAGWRRKGR